MRSSIWWPFSGRSPTLWSSAGHASQQTSRYRRNRTEKDAPHGPLYFSRGDVIMPHKPTGLSLVFLLLCTYGSLSADTLQGEFTFHKKAPEVALVYLPEDTSLSSDVEPVLDQQEKTFTPP